MEGNFTLSIGHQTKIESNEHVSLRVNAPEGVKSFLCINSSECDWAMNGEKPLIQPMLIPDDFWRLGFDMQDYKAACELKIGEVINVFTELEGDYEGVYIMRIS